MKNFPKKSLVKGYLSVIPIVLFAISISIMDFTDLNWESNQKSYIGLILFLVSVILLIPLWRKNNK